MVRLLIPLILFTFAFFFLSPEAKSLDPYKVLGVDRNANQRDIQKAFHKLSLQYHPDKNKSKGAQERFAEINNAYEILSDEEKRKNYDLYGDEKGASGFDGGNFGGGNFGSREGYTYFTTGGAGDSRFSFRPDGWQQMGGQGNAKTFSFSFGGDPGVGGGPFDFGFGDLFSNFFGGHSRSGSQFGSSSGSSGAGSGSSHPGSIQDISLQTFRKEITVQGFTWLLLFYTPTAKGYDVLESIVQDTANSLRGALKAGGINCQREQALCKDLGVWPSKSASVFVYSYKTGEKGSLVEYNGEYDRRSLKTFCQDQLPRFSLRVSLSRFDFSSSTKGNLPQVLLLSTKKDTPVIWRVLSGLYHKRIIFYDAEVHDVTDEKLRRFRVDVLPAVVGRLSNGEEFVLKTGIAIKDLSTGISEMKTLLDSFEKRNKKVAGSNQEKKSSQTETRDTAIPYLTRSNVDTICGDKAPLCIIGVFRSLKAKNTIDQILSLLSQKTLTRRQIQAPSSGDSVSYSLLDATKQTAFLNSFDRSGYKSSDKLLLAYKPRKGKFAVFKNEMTLEEVERFIGSVLNGDVQFSKIRHKPVLQ